MAFFYTEEQKALLCKLINEANPKLELEPRTLDNTRLGPPLVYAPQEGEIANTRMMVFSLPGHTFVGKQEFKYRRINMGSLFNHMVLDFDHWLEQDTIDRTILCEWINDRYQLNLVPEDLEDGTWPTGGGTHSANILASSYNFQGSILFRWDKNKRKLDQIIVNKENAGRLWDIRHGGEVDTRPLMTLVGFRGDYTTFLDTLQNIRTGMAVDDIKEELRPLVERFNSLFNTELSVDIPHTEVNGLGGLSVLKPHLPSLTVPEADVEYFNRVLTIPSVDDSWFGGSVFFHHNDFKITIDDSEFLLPRDFVAGSAWRSRNHSHNSSDSNSWHIGVLEGDVLTFSWSVSSERNYDKLYISVDGVTKVNNVSGSRSGTVRYVATESKTVTIYARYRKDGSVSRYRDDGYVSAIQITREAVVGDLTFTVEQAHAQPNTLYYWSLEGTGGETIFKNNRGTLLFDQPSKSVTLVQDDDGTNFSLGGALVVKLRRFSVDGPVIEESRPIEVPELASQKTYTVPGNHYWVVPEGVTNISAVCVGGGGAGGGQQSDDGEYGSGGGGGGGLRWRNDIPVTPGDRLHLVVGSGGAGGYAAGAAGGISYINLPNNVRTLHAYGGRGGLSAVDGYHTAPGGGGGISGSGGGSGGGGNGGNGAPPDHNGGRAGGGGAGGYSGNGGKGGWGAGAGGAGAGGDISGGGGVGVLGQGPIGHLVGGGGSGGASGSEYDGGEFGGGGTGVEVGTRKMGGSGGDGVVRIIWGYDRAFPAHRTEDIVY